MHDAGKTYQKPGAVVMLRTAYIVASVLLITFFTLSGCTQYVPIADPIRPWMVPEFKSNQAITLENVQKSKKAVIGPRGDNKAMGDLYNWTDAVIKMLKTELENRNMKVSVGAEKLLRLSVHRAYTSRGFYVAVCVVDLKVETGNGYTNVFKGNNKSPSRTRACNFAITKAVEAMLSDKTILAYITQ